jgi:hypothetical protein
MGKKKQEFIEDQKEKMNINLKKNNLFEENKIYDRSSQVFFTRTYMKMTYEDYKKIQEEKKNYKKLNDELNMKIERLYKKKEKVPYSDIKKIMRDQNMDNVFKRAQTEIMKPSKEYLMEYAKEFNPNESNLYL